MHLHTKFGIPTSNSVRDMTKTQVTFTYKRAKRLALSKLVTTRLQWTDKKEWQTLNINSKNDPQKKHRLGMVSKNSFTGRHKLVLWYQLHPNSRCGSRKIDVWFAWKIHILSMYHLLLSTNRYIKIDKTKIRTQQYILLNTELKTSNR